ncbi:MAG: DNA polymerase III subunit delta [Lachnospiraceae bacterium]|nr:DNA polymerase III subunit delta [Lachnospiraceae bacterium]
MAGRTGRGGKTEGNPLVQIKKDIQEKNFHRVYLLMGDEDYRISQVKNLLEKSLIPQGFEINLEKFEETKVDLNEVRSLLMTAPFSFSPDGKRLVILDRTDTIKTAKDALVDVMESIPETSVLVICQPEVDKRSKAYKWIKKNGFVAEFAKKDINDQDRLKMVAVLLSRGGKRIRQNDAQYFLSRVGDDLYEIKNEVDKLISYLGEETDVNREAIDAISSGAVEDKVFDMVSAIAAKNKKAALAYYNDLIILKEPSLRILALIIRQYRILLIMASMSKSGRSDADIAKAAGVMTFVVKKAWVQLRGETVWSIKDHLEQCLSVEEDIKTGNITDQIGVETLIVSLSERA